MNSAKRKAQRRALTAQAIEENGLQFNSVSLHQLQFPLLSTGSNDYRSEIYSFETSISSRRKVLVLVSAHRRGAEVLQPAPPKKSAALPTKGSSTIFTISSILRSLVHGRESPGCTLFFLSGSVVIVCLLFLIHCGQKVSHLFTNLRHCVLVRIREG